MRFSSHMAAQGGSKKGLIIGAIVVLAAAGGGFAFLRGKGGPATPVDSTAAATPAPVHVAADSAADSTKAATPDTTHHDSTAATSAPHDSTTAPTAAPVATTATPAPKPAADTTAPAGGIEAMALAPTVDRGPVPWSNRPAGGPTLSIASLEAVRSRYAAAQDRALQQFEASLEVAEFATMFAPAKSGTASARQGAFDAVDGARTALRDFRRRQSALDFAYTDSLRAALPPGSDSPDLRTFGPLLKESPAQAALTDSLLSEVADMYGMLVSEAGGYTIKGAQITWKDQDNATQYQNDQELLTAQLARTRLKSPSEIPSALGAVLRGIGLPR